MCKEIIEKLWWRRAIFSVLDSVSISLDMMKKLNFTENCFKGSAFNSFLCKFRYCFFLTVHVYIRGKVSKVHFYINSLHVVWCTYTLYVSQLLFRKSINEITGNCVLLAITCITRIRTIIINVCCNTFMIKFGQGDQTQ